MKKSKGKHKMKDGFAQKQNEEVMLEVEDEEDEENSVLNERSRYSYAEKQKILFEAKTLTSFQICQKYDMSERTLRKWKNKQNEIAQISKNKNLKDLKKLNTSSCTRKLDEELDAWHRDALQKGVAVSGPILKQQALIINARIGGDKNFKASEGWLSRYKERTKSRALKITGQLHYK